MRISVVIPTYNRNDDLSRVIDRILASEIDGFEQIEVIVVDDGSPISAESVVNKLEIREPFAFRYLRQDNAGPAEARNHGYRIAENDIILFIDDDVLVEPDVLRKHVTAHSDLPGSVVVGPYPYLIPDRQDAEFRFLNSLLSEASEEITRKIRSDFPYVRINAVASGNLSVSRDTFGERVYRDGLEIPAGEEFEMNARLGELGIPIYFAPDIQAWHLQPPTLEGACIQNYKYGLGVAEVALKDPRVMGLDDFKRVLTAHNELSADDPWSTRVKKIIRKPLAVPGVRSVLLRILSSRWSKLPGDRILFPMYRFLVGTYLFAGVREGLVRFRG